MGNRKEPAFQGLQERINATVPKAAPVKESGLSPPAWKEGSPEWVRALKNNGGVWPQRKG